jgi:hypothetical protein
MYIYNITNIYEKKSGGKKNSIGSNKINLLLKDTLAVEEENLVLFSVFEPGNSTLVQRNPNASSRTEGHIIFRFMSSSTCTCTGIENNSCSQHVHVLVLENPVLYIL